jgi:hypothetical protein
MPTESLQLNLGSLRSVGLYDVTIFVTIIGKKKPRHETSSAAFWSRDESKLHW